MQACQHTRNANGYCDQCGAELGPETLDAAGNATHGTCPNGHTVRNANGYCDACGLSFGDPPKEGPDGVAIPIFGATCPNGHTTRNANGYCDQCGLSFEERA